MHLQVYGPFGLPHTFLVATRAVKRGEELLTDYGALASREDLALCPACCAAPLRTYCLFTRE